MVHILNLLKWRRSLQYLAGVTAAITFLIVGVVSAWTSPTLPKLEAEDSVIPVTRDQGSWIVSILGVGGILTPIPVGYLVNRYGRKPLLLSTALPFFLAWLLTIFASSATEILIARTVFGFGVGVTFAVCPIYQAEIAEKNVRGMLGALMQLMMNVGSLFSYSVGPYVSYKALGVLSAIFPVMYLVLMFYMPETPYFLLMQNRRDEAEATLMRLRGRANQQDIQEELADMQTALLQQTKEKGRPYDLIATRGTRRALIVAFGLIIIQQFGGIMAILSNAQDVFEITPGNSITSTESAIVVGVIRVVVSIGTIFLVDRLGRRLLLLVSTSGCAVALAVMGAYQYVHLTTAVDTTPYDWLPLACVVVFLVSYYLGVGPLPLMMMAEMFASNVKGLALSVGSMLVSLCFVVVTKLYQVAVDGIGPYITFWFFAGVSATGIAFVFFLVPETKGKSLECIVTELNETKRVKQATAIGQDQSGVFTVST